MPNRTASSGRNMLHAASLASVNQFKTFRASSGIVRQQQLGDCFLAAAAGET